MPQSPSLTTAAPVNEKVIVERFIGGDDTCFEVLFKKYYQMLRKVAGFYLADNETVEELVQDVFVNIWEKRQNVNPDASFKNYLITAVKNRCINAVKARKKNQSLDDGEEWHEVLAADARTESHVLLKETHKAIEAAIDALPEQCRIIFQLSRIEGMSYKEIAEALDIAPKTVENQIGRALKVLREQLKDYYVFLLVLFN